jgi:hypothetical protein
MLKVLSENLALLASLIVLVGVSSTDSYYHYFGLSYQLLDLPSNHLVYRGLTAVFESGWVIFMYIVAICLVAAQSQLRLLLGRERRVQWLNYIAVVVLAFAAWWAGTYVGEAAARDDAKTGANLPLLSRLNLKNGTSAVNGALEGIRLLLHSRDGVYIFKPVSDPRQQTPLVRFISAEIVEELSLCAHCSNQ